MVPNDFPIPFGGAPVRVALTALDQHMTSHEFFVRFGLAALVVILTMAAYAILMYRDAITANRNTVLGLIMGILMWLTFTYPTFDAPAVIAGIAAGGAAAYGARSAAPFAIWGKNLRTQIKEWQEAHKEKEKTG